MKHKQFFITLFLALTMLLPASAQTQQQMAQLLQTIRGDMAVVQSYAQNTQQMYQLAQMGGSPQDFQILQAEWQLHEQVYAYLQQMAQNPQVLVNPSAQRQYNAVMNEYRYRLTQRDFRPSQQIQGQLQQYANYTNWQATTPAGQASFQAEQRQNQAIFDQQQAQVRYDSNQRDKYHQQYVNTIHDNYQYVNPYDGQSYVLPNVYNTPPTVQNPDGSYSQMVPYQHW